MRGTVLGALAAGVLAAGCQDNQLGLERRAPNRPPETVLSGGPTDAPSGTDYRVHLFWSGADPDGAIDHFDYILVDHPANGDSLHTVDSLAVGRFAGSVPEPDDPRWRAIFSNDSVFVTRADVFPRPPRPGPGETNEFVRRQSHERWHTFYIRAVDLHGAIDRTPDYRSFNSRTVAPTVNILPPIRLGFEFQAPTTSIISWEGRDPLDSGEWIDPIASRWILIPSRKDQFGIYAGFPDSIYAADDSRWSPWRAWRARDGSGRRAILRELEPISPGRPGAGFYLFAVQAMDEAGAVSPVFDDRTPLRNNATRIAVTGSIGPTLVVGERYLGNYTFTSNSNRVALEIASEQPISFQWRADASGYGGEVAAYRWGWNIRDPNDDAAWQQNWSATATAAPARSFAAGTQRFWIQARDEAGTTSGVTFELVVHTVSPIYDILLVDDTVHPQADTEPFEDQRWISVLSELATEAGLDFQPTRDVYDVAGPEARNTPPPLSRVFDYDTVIWAVVSSTRGSALRDLATFYDPIPERNRGRIGHFNYLTYYIERGGHLWVCGAQPGHVLFPIGDRPVADQLPVNVVNWDDPVQPHPEVDSVGVGSLLYKLGVEALDIGAGRSGPPRLDHLEHACIRFRWHGENRPEGAPDVLETDARWPLPQDPRLNPLRGRPNVEIYDMPRYMITRVPPLRPDPTLVWWPYVYESAVREGSSLEAFYPQTADGQPVVILRKTRAEDPHYTRAVCGFEPWFLRRASHLGLTRFIVVHGMGRGRVASTAGDRQAAR